MWLVFAASAILFYLVYELLSKYAISKDSDLAPYRLRICLCIAFFIGFVVTWLGGLGESGKNPFEIIVSNPLMIVLTICTFVAEFLYLISLRYIGLPIQEAVSGINGPMLFVFLVLFNAFFGRFSDIKNMLVPTKLVPLIIMLICVFLLPVVDYIKNPRLLLDNPQNSRKKFSLGIIIAVIAVVFDVFDGLLTAAVLDTGEIGSIDFISVAFLISFLYGVLFLFLAGKKAGGIRRLVSGNTVVTIGATASYIVYLFMTSTATSLNAAYTSIVWIFYPVLPIIFSRIILKEKCTLRQNICIGIILVMTVVFSLQE